MACASALPFSKQTLAPLLLADHPQARYVDVSIIRANHLIFLPFLPLAMFAGNVLFWLSKTKYLLNTAA